MKTKSTKLMALALGLGVTAITTILFVSGCKKDNKFETLAATSSSQPE